MIRWRRLFRLDRVDAKRDIDDELRFHLEARIDDLVTSGMAPAAARLEAERIFGDADAIRESCIAIDQRHHRRLGLLEGAHDMLNDLRFAARALRRSPAFTAAAVACVALGIGMTTTIFSTVHAVLIRPLPYPDADGLVAIYAQSASRGARGVNISIPDYLSWREMNRSFESLGMWTWTTHTLTDDTGAERVEGASVTAGVLTALGVRPLIGRGFIPEEETEGRNRVVVLGHDLWQRRLGGAPLVGRTIAIDGVAHTVVGIMPPNFNFPDRGQLWVPFVPDPAGESHGNRAYAGAVARLHPGLSVEDARREMNAISARLAAEFPNDNAEWAAEVLTMREDLTGDLRKPLLVIFGAVGLVLLIACANVANLMLARGTARSREIAIRVAIGAGRARLARQVLAESLVVALAGGAIGAALAVGGVALLRALLPADMPFYIQLRVEPIAWIFALAASAVTALSFGLVPALRAGAVDAGSSLRDGSKGMTATVRQGRLRGALVVAEIALSLILMIGAMLFIRSYRALEHTTLGFDEQGILSVRVSLPYAAYPQRPPRFAFYDALFTRVRAMPGVETVGSAQGIPFRGWNVESRLMIDGRPVPPNGAEAGAHYQYVTPDYFAALGIPLLRGRALTAADRDSAAPAVLINEEFARRWLGGEDPLGKRLRFGDAKSEDPWVTVVGVVGDFRHYRLPEPMRPAVYLPYASMPLLSQTLVIRTSLPDPLVLVPSVRAAIRELDPNVAAYEVQTIDEVVSRSLWRQRFQGEVLGAFAVLALFLTAVGIYGVVSYAVAQRTRELGVRIALGATRRDVLGLVLAQGARLALVGVAIGVVAALGLSRVVASLLHGVGPMDPLTFITVSATLAGVAIAACYVPALRATRVDPLVAMRAE
jgi:predicted permease